MNPWSETGGLKSMMQGGESSGVDPGKKAYGWSDAVFLAAVPVLAFVIVALFRLGACHFFRSLNDWTTASPVEVLDVFRDIAVLIWSSLSDMRWVVFYPGLFLSAIGVVTALNRNVKGFDDMTFMGALVAFFASFKFSPIVSFGIVWLFVSHGETIRKFLARGENVSPAAFAKPSVQLVAGLMLILTPFYYLGYMGAYVRTDYYLAGNPPNYALLQTYEDYIIAAPASVTKNEKGDETLDIVSGVKSFKLGSPDTPEFFRYDFRDVSVDGNRVWSPILWVWIP